LTNAGPASDLVGVLILRLPLPLYQRASEHSDELLREFALIREDSSDHVPSRLLALIEELNARFAGFTSGPSSALHEALDRGDGEVDLRYDVPPDVADGARRLGTLLDEADDFCRSGDLLTLATLPESVAFRRWFLDEFVRQTSGEPPRPWPAYLEATAPG
jgi:hypothetical protein